MEFSVFVHRLHAIIGAGSSTSAFTKSIFEAILADEAPEVTDEYSDDTFKAYYNGHTQITRLAKKITAYIEPFNFKGYIDNFSDAARDSLADSFSDVFPEADSYNISDQLAGLFESILKEAAATRRSSPKCGKGEQPTDACNQDEEPTQAEVIPDSDVKVQIINNPTIVNQYGHKNVHIEHLDVLNL